MRDRKSLGRARERIYHRYVGPKIMEPALVFRSEVSATRSNAWMTFHDLLGIQRWSFSHFRDDWTRYWIWVFRWLDWDLSSGLRTIEGGSHPIPQPYSIQQQGSLNMRILPLSYHSKARYHGVSLAGRWWPNIECWLGSFVIFQGLRTSIAMEPYILMIPPPPPPPLDRPWVPLFLRRGLLSYSGQASSTFHDNIRCSPKNNKMTRSTG